MSENRIVPDLRFIDFQNSRGWDEKTLTDISVIIAGQSPDGSSYNELGNGIPFYQGKTDYGTLYLNKPTKWTTMPTKFADSGDILMSVRAPVGALNVTIERICIGRGLAAIQAKENKWFLFYYLDSIQSKITGNGGSVFDSITKDQIEKIRVFIPNSLEQQKIADCLSSLDDVITAQTQKLDLLKAHKKGLMQDLFPAEGESVPRLRFSGFEGEWEEKQLIELLSQNPEYGINAPAVPYSPSLPQYLRITDISEDGQYIKSGMVSVNSALADNYYLSKGDIVLARTGASVGKSYKYQESDGKLVFAGFLIRVRPNEKLNVDFLNQFYSTERYWKWVSFISARSGQPGINGSEYASMPIMVPPYTSEQQKIADCLSSLDDQIQAQTQKIESLKLHKKGLMQQLFPNLNP